MSATCSLEHMPAGDSHIKGTHSPFPQPKSLGAALQEAQLVLLGNLLAVVSTCSARVL